MPEHDTESAQTSAPQRAQAGASAAPALPSTSEIRRLNGRIGNRALARLIAAHDDQGLITHRELATRLRQAYASRPSGRIPPSMRRYRLPTAADIKAMLAAGAVSEADLIAGIGSALTRMHTEGRLKTKDKVADILKRLFPSKGKFDEAEFAKVVDTADRSKIYQSVADANSTLKAADKPKFIDAINKSVFMIETLEKKPTDLDPVFGTKAADALVVYGKAKAALIKAKSNLDVMVDADYNLDDPETGLGGWATNSPGQHMHLMGVVAQVKDLKETIATLIHEATHMADGTVDDDIYYGVTGFESMADARKVKNAAHYEEVPRRYMGKSKFAGKTFTPGVKASGAAPTFNDQVQEDVQQYFRKAWDKAVDVHMFLRGIRREVLAGNAAEFTTNKTRVLEVSKLEKLTIHKQAAGKQEVSALDIVLAEGIPRKMGDLQTIAAGKTVPDPPPKSKAAHVDDVITASLAAAGDITGNAADDRKLTDWLVAEYRKPL